MQNEGFIYSDNLNNDSIHVNDSRTNDCGIFTTPHTRRMEESNNTFDETTTIIPDINIQICPSKLKRLFRQTR
jgi:hypothetical protein